MFSLEGGDDVLDAVQIGVNLLAIIFQPVVRAKVRSGVGHDRVKWRQTGSVSCLAESGGSLKMKRKTEAKRTSVRE
jgi:hypothetical protein